MTLPMDIFLGDLPMFSKSWGKPKKIRVAVQLSLGLLNRSSSAKLSASAEGAASCWSFQISIGRGRSAQFGVLLQYSSSCGSVQRHRCRLAGPGSFADHFGLRVEHLDKAMMKEPGFLGDSIIKISFISPESNSNAGGWRDVENSSRCPTRFWSSLKEVWKIFSGRWLSCLVFLTSGIF